MIPQRIKQPLLLLSAAYTTRHSYLPVRAIVGGLCCFLRVLMLGNWSRSFSISIHVLWLLLLPTRIVHSLLPLAHVKVLQHPVCSVYSPDSFRLRQTDKHVQKSIDGFQIQHGTRLLRIIFTFVFSGGARNNELACSNCRGEGDESGPCGRLCALHEYISVAYGILNRIWKRIYSGKLQYEFVGSYVRNALELLLLLLLSLCFHARGCNKNRFKLVRTWVHVPYIYDTLVLLKKINTPTIRNKKEIF